MPAPQSNLLLWAREGRHNRTPDGYQESGGLWRILGQDPKG